MEDLKPIDLSKFLDRSGDWQGECQRAYEEMRRTGILIVKVYFGISFSVFCVLHARDMYSLSPSSLTRARSLIFFFSS